LSFKPDRLHALALLLLLRPGSAGQL